MEEFLTVHEAADQAQVAPSTIYRWIQGGVLSFRYFQDGRQAILKEEVTRLAQRGENTALIHLFLQVAEALGQVVALLPAVEHQFGAGWEGHAWNVAEWERIRVMAMQQAEGHRDIAPFVPRRGRPPKSAVQRFRDARPATGSTLDSSPSNG